MKTWPSCCDLIAMSFVLATAVGFIAVAVAFRNVLNATATQQAGVAGHNPRAVIYDMGRARRAR
jgi:hypothetical protein